MGERQTLALAATDRPAGPGETAPVYIHGRAKLEPRVCLDGRMLGCWAAGLLGCWDAEWMRCDVMRRRQQHPCLEVWWCVWSGAAVVRVRRRLTCATRVFGEYAAALPHDRHTRRRRFKLSPRAVRCWICHPTYIQKFNTAVHK